MVYFDRIQGNFHRQTRSIWNSHSLFHQTHDNRYRLFRIWITDKHQTWPIDKDLCLLSVEPVFTYIAFNHKTFSIIRLAANAIHSFIFVRRHFATYKQDGMDSPHAKLSPVKAQSAEIALWVRSRFYQWKYISVEFSHPPKSCVCKTGALWDWKRSTRWSQEQTIVNKMWHIKWICTGLPNIKGMICMYRCQTDNSSPLISTIPHEIYLVTNKHYIYGFWLVCTFILSCDFVPQQFLFVTCFVSFQGLLTSVIIIRNQRHVN